MLSIQEEIRRNRHVIKIESTEYSCVIHGIGNYHTVGMGLSDIVCKLCLQTAKDNMKRVIVMREVVSCDEERIRKIEAPNQGDHFDKDGKIVERK